MTLRSLRKIPLIWLVGLAGIPAAQAAVPQITSEDRPILDAVLGHAKTIGEGLNAARFQAIKCPEDLCWVDFPKINTLLSAYELTGDTTHLRSAAAALEAALSTLVKGEDGTRSWYGPGIAGNLDPAKPETRIREIQTDFRAVAVLSRFIELTDADATLKAEFAPKRAGWIELMDKELVGYWHAQGYFQDLGERGAIYQWNKDYRPTAARLTLPHEKLSIMVDGLLGLYRVGGNDEQALRAAKVGLWLKRCLAMNEADKHYSWSRWTPAGNWDIHPENPAKWKTWVGADPKAQWYAAAVHTAAQLYRLGLVFSREDMDRFTVTQTKVCWNGNAAEPKFAQTDGQPAKENERFIAPELAAFNEPFADFVYGPAATADRLKSTASEWKGGILAAQWLQGKYIELPDTKAGSARSRQIIQAFLSKPENAAFSAEKTFTVSAPGFTTPPAPTAPASP